MGEHRYSFPSSVAAQNLSLSSSSLVMPRSLSELYFDNAPVLYARVHSSSPFPELLLITRKSASSAESSASISFSSDRRVLTYASYSLTGVHLTQYHSPAICPLVRNTSSAVADPDPPFQVVRVCVYSPATISGERFAKRPSASGGSSNWPPRMRTAILSPLNRSPINSPPAN